MRAIFTLLFALVPLCMDSCVGVPVGSLRVAVLDADGLSLEACQQISADVTDEAVSWLGRQDLSALQGEQIRLCFELHSAKLYAFGFAG